MIDTISRNVKSGVDQRASFLVEFIATSEQNPFGDASGMTCPSVHEKDDLEMRPVP